MASLSSDETGRQGCCWNARPWENASHSRCPEGNSRVPWHTVACTVEPQIGRLTDKQAPPAASAPPGVLCLENFPPGRGQVSRALSKLAAAGSRPEWGGTEEPHVGSLALAALTSPSLVLLPPCSRPAPQLPLPSQRSSVLASSAAAGDRPMAPWGHSSVTPATGWTQSAAQGGVSMDSHQGAR